MQILNYDTTRQLLTRPFAPQGLAQSVQETLSRDHWHIGQPETLDQVAAWLTPDVEPQAQGAGVFDLGAGSAILALAIHYFTQRYPDAATLDIASAASMVEYGVTCRYGGFGTDGYGLERQCEQLLMACLGGAMGEDGWGVIPQEALDRDPSDEQTRLLFNLIEGVYFKARAPKEHKATIQAAHNVRERFQADEAADPAAVIAEVVAMLDSTRHAFKSKVIAEAKAKLQALL